MSYPSSYSEKKTLHYCKNQNFGEVTLEPFISVQEHFLVHKITFVCELETVQYDFVKKEKIKIFNFCDNLDQ